MSRALRSSTRVRHMTSNSRIVVLSIIAAHALEHLIDFGLPSSHRQVRLKVNQGLCTGMLEYFLDQFLPQFGWWASDQDSSRSRVRSTSDERAIRVASSCSPCARWYLNS